MKGEARLRGGAGRRRRLIRQPSDTQPCRRAWLFLPTFLPTFREPQNDLQDPDLCDQFEADLGASVRVVAPMFKRYGGRNAFSGRIATLKLFEDNSLGAPPSARTAEGKVLVIDGGGSLRCCAGRDQLAILAQKTAGKVSSCMAASATRATSTVSTSASARSTRTRRRASRKRR